MNKIAIIYTTFLRPDLARETLLSIRGHKEHLILVGDQGDEDNKNHIIVNQRFEYTNRIDISLPFDCGVSFARNELIKTANKLKYEYCIITADSIRFTNDGTYFKFLPHRAIPKIELAIQYLDSQPTVGILGFDLSGRVPWEYNMDIADGKFILTKAGELEVDQLTGLRVRKCDICRQFL